MRATLRIWGILGLILLGVVASVKSLPATPICPTAALSGNQAYITAGGGCNEVITFAANGSISTAITNPHPYDGFDDALIGVVNNTHAPITSFHLTSSQAIFGFDGDGICDSRFGVAPCTSANSTNNYGGGAGVTFSGINGPETAGTVNFANGILGNGGTNFFSLEAPASLDLAVAPTPEPTTLLLFGTMLSGVGAAVRYRMRRGVNDRVV